MSAYLSHHCSCQTIFEPAEGGESELSIQKQIQFCSCFTVVVVGGGSVVAVTVVVLLMLLQLLLWCGFMLLYLLLFLLPLLLLLLLLLLDLFFSIDLWIFSLFSMR